MPSLLMLLIKSKTWTGKYIFKVAAKKRRPKIGLDWVWVPETDQYTFNVPMEPVKGKNTSDGSKIYLLAK